MIAFISAENEKEIQVLLFDIQELLRQEVLRELDRGSLLAVRHVGAANDDSECMDVDPETLYGCSVWETVSVKEINLSPNAPLL